MSHKVLDVFLKERNRVMNYKQVAARLHEKENHIKLIIVESLRDLAKGGKLIEVERGGYRLANFVQKGIEGTIDISRRGMSSDQGLLGIGMCPQSPEVSLVMARNHNTLSLR